MKTLFLSIALFAAASVIKIAFDAWELLRPSDCIAVQRAGSDRDAGLVYKGVVPCPTALKGD